MKRTIGNVILVALANVFMPSAGFAQQPVNEPTVVADSPTPEPESGEVAAIRAGSEAFVTAFNRGDAKAIAALWTEGGEYVDDSGSVFVGRDAIEKVYAELFAANPGGKIEIMIDSIRVVGSNTAIEEGRASALIATGSDSGSTSYTVVHSKEGGKWLMASVRDASVDPPADASSAADLDWLLGEWTAEEEGVETKSVCRWVAEGRFLERAYTTTQVDGSTSSGVQMIGWNPIAGHVQSWNFSPDGGHAAGIWIPQPDGWTAQLNGQTGDGELTMSINVLRRLDDNAYVWQSIHRSVGGVALPDTGEVIWKRQPVKR
jgi:uncharacterized protein (TIGR02246 family)